MSYSKGIIAIPNVTGDIVITVTTEPINLTNLFDADAAAYNYRIRNVGLLGSASGKLTTAPIDITDISTLTIQGITELVDSSGEYLGIGLYPDLESALDQTSSGVTLVESGSRKIIKVETYTINTATLKETYPTATYMRLEFYLVSGGNCSKENAKDLKIYGV